MRVRSLLVAGWLALAAQRASADTIVLDASTPRGQSECQRIAQEIAPAKLFTAPGGGPLRYLRGRIIGATPSAPGSAGRPQLTVEAWWTGGGGTYVWGGRQTQVGTDVIKYVQHEFDGHLDLQLMLSSRDERLAAGQPVAPIGSPAWRTRLLRVLDPNGALGVVAGQRQPPETAAELAAVTHRGWLLFCLTEDLVPVAPESPTSADAGADAAAKARRRLAYDALMRARQTAYTDEVKTQGANLLHPRVVSLPASDAVHALLEGVARVRDPRYAFLKQRVDAEPNVPSLPAGQTLAGVGRNFEERAVIAVGFLCTLSRVATPASPPPRAANDPEGLIEPAHLRYQRFGREARDALLGHLEAAADDALATDASGQEIDAWVDARIDDASDRAAAKAAMASGRLVLPLPQAARLDVTPADVAHVGLQVVQQFEGFWLREATEGRRLVRALVALAREAPAGASPSRQALTIMARETLIRLLRPDARRVASDPRELAALMGHARKFQQDLEDMFMHQDPAVRAAVQTVLVHAGVTNVATDGAIDELFALAASENQPDAPDQTVRRATRRYAVTVLTLLGVLADPEVGATEKDRATGERVFARLQDLRDVVESGQGSRGEGDLIRLLDRLPRVVEPDLRERVERFQGLEVRHVRRRFEAARDDVRRLERMVMDNGAAVDAEDTERLRRLRGDLSRLGRRMELLNSSVGQQ